MSVKLIVGESNTNKYTRGRDYACDELHGYLCFTYDGVKACVINTRVSKYP